MFKFILLFKEPRVNSYEVIVSLITGRCLQLGEMTAFNSVRTGSYLCDSE